MRRTMVVIAALALGAGACGGDASLGVAEAWSRPALGPNGAVYVTFEGGEVDTALNGVAVSSAVADTAEIHQTVIRDDGLMGMTRIPQVEIPAESTVIMVPGGIHLMLVDLTEPLELGDTFEMTLTFDNGTKLIAEVEVRDE